jgi:Phytanoyl-CoA dioxygenase (PhyH)
MTITPSPERTLTYSRDGAERFDGAITAELTDIRNALGHLPPDRAGVRIAGIEAPRSFLQPDGAIGAIAANVLGAHCRAVRAILFDKTPMMNWSLAWDQDRTICVVQRLEVEGFGPWTVKHGMHHVSPAFDLLARMVTLQVHLDDVPITNAPLMIAPGSHRLGSVTASRIPDPFVRRDRGMPRGGGRCLAVRHADFTRVRGSDTAQPPTGASGGLFG